MMQIASNCTSCACSKCQLCKADVSSKVKLSKEKSQTPRSSRRRSFSRAKTKTRQNYDGGNQHRLDHTYAAATTKSQAPASQSTASADENSDEIHLKSNWLRNLCLEYQPARKSAQTDSNSSGVEPAVSSSEDRQNRFHFTGNNGTLKQYQRNRKVAKNKADLSSTFLGKNTIIKSVQEDKKRWIAALALMELAQSK